MKEMAMALRLYRHNVTLASPISFLGDNNIKSNLQGII